MTMRWSVLHPLLWWFYTALAVTGMCGILYVSMQQSFRQNLNDPQIQMAEDAANALERGSALVDLVPTQKVLVDQSLAPFLIIYDTEGNPIAGNGYLHDQLVNVPLGVFENAKAWGENRRTLEPVSGVRIASVVVPFVGREANGYVLAGRTMREIESRIADVGIKIFFAWAVILSALLVASIAISFLLWRSN